ncbi:RDD family protein [Rubellicoccus peritrichatus]|uniref:RDD family protein n=1 Tax=Rubellicoccus peritrichatus TaxID=3080537 RepID=A0AAQ3QTT0_9BACT|nr:RDD family protein [Puniceicoccus sp. CR14]WOO41656.1 RDD family protein [Puniceicoccus sp. CR14]
MGHRSLAFLLDCLLVGALALFLLDKFLIPMYHPTAQEEMRKTFSAYEEAVNEAYEKGAPTPPAADYITTSDTIIEAVEFGIYVAMLMFFSYFLIAELSMRGMTLGKKMFRIQTIALGTIHPPGALQASLRAAMKTFFIFGIIPITWLGFIMAFFVSQRRTGHDILARTLVVTEIVPLPKADEAGRSL